MITDKYGNELKVGDQLLITPDKGMFYGEIAELKPGMLSLPSNVTERPVKQADAIIFVVQLITEPPFNKIIHKVYGLPKEER